MKLQRGQQEGNKKWKLHNDVSFPEVLTCMRSGEYHFCAAIRHQGALPTSGHYLTNCWLGGDAYVEINCAPKRHRRLSWHQFCNGIGEEVYILVYARMSY